MMMEIPDEIFDRAFAIYEEFGPDRLIDRRERLEAELGIHSPETIDLIIERMKEISKIGHDLGDRETRRGDQAGRGQSY
ncbi:MAG: hypothetical protein P8Z42_13110 [Anaerolineales bacterium]